MVWSGLAMQMVVITHQIFRLPAASVIWVMEAAGWSVDSCRRFGTTVCGGEILTAVLVKIQVVWNFSPCRLINLPSPSGSTALDESTMFHRNVRNPSPVDRAGHVTVYDASFTDLWRSLPHSQKPYIAILFIPCVDILKLWLTPISAQFYSLCTLYITCRCQ